MIGFAVFLKINERNIYQNNGDTKTKQNDITKRNHALKCIKYVHHFLYPNSSGEVWRKLSIHNQSKKRKNEPRYATDPKIVRVLRESPVIPGVQDAMKTKLWT
jgi:hypothetical protein